MIDIQDRKKLMRVPIDEIAAVRVAGSYVGLVLINNCRSLARRLISFGRSARVIGIRMFVPSWTSITVYIMYRPLWNVCREHAGDGRENSTSMKRSERPSACFGRRVMKALPLLT